MIHKTTTTITHTCCYRQYASRLLYRYWLSMWSCWKGACMDEEIPTFTVCCPVKKERTTNAHISNLPVRQVRTVRRQKATWPHVMSTVSGSLTFLIRWLCCGGTGLWSTALPLTQRTGILFGICSCWLLFQKVSFSTVNWSYTILTEAHSNIDNISIVKDTTVPMWYDSDLWPSHFYTVAVDSFYRIIPTFIFLILFYRL